MVQEYPMVRASGKILQIQLSWVSGEVIIGRGLPKVGKGEINLIGWDYSWRKGY